MIIPCPVANPAFAGRPALLPAAGEPCTFAQLHSRAEAVGAVVADPLAPGDTVSVCVAADLEHIALLLGLWRRRLLAQLLSPREPEAVMAERQTHVKLALHHRDLVGGTPATGNNDRAEWDLSAPATIVYTSGSSGTPKAAVHSLGNHYYSALGANTVLPLAAGDRWLLSLPLYHVGGLGILFRCFVAGAAIALRRPQEGLAAAIERIRPTHVSLVPTQLRRLLPTPAINLPGVLLVGGAPLPPDLAQAVDERSLPVYTTYGLTEMSSQVTTGDQLTDSGTLLEHRELRVSSEDEILVRGDCLFLGYRGDNGDIDPAVDDDGWFHTGDLGRLQNGRLTVTGRHDNMFISGGENIQPEEIEAALLAVPGVEQAIVVPVEDAEFGHRPTAFLTGNWDAASLRAELLRTLPRFKVPIDFAAIPAAACTGIKPSRPVLKRLATGG